MANWDEKYIVTKLKENIVPAPWIPKFTPDEAMLLLTLDGEVRKDAFYMDLAWYWPGDWPKSKSEEEGSVKTHKHEYDEAIAYIGTDPEDPYDLGGEVELWIDGKKNIIDKTFVAFIPAGTEHGPLTIRRVDKPMFHFTAGMGKKYY